MIFAVILLRPLCISLPALFKLVIKAGLMMPRIPPGSFQEIGDVVDSVDLFMFS